MSPKARKATSLLLIALGIVLLFASVTYWLDINTSNAPIGLGQNVLLWGGIIADLLIWLSAYLVNKKNGSDVKHSPHISPQIIIHGNVNNSNINMGDNNELIVSKDEKGNTDYQQSISNAYKYLEGVKTEFDKENASFAKKLLENVKGIIVELGDESLSLEYELLESKLAQKLEMFDEARSRYENISKRYPKDARPLLYLAEICLINDDLDGNNFFLEKAESIDRDLSLLKLHQILRKQYVGEKIDIGDINQESFSDNPKEKANFYRLYGLMLENSGDHTNADSFIAKAIHLNPDRFNAYIDELSLIEGRMFASESENQRNQLSQSLLGGAEKLEKRFSEYGDVGPRNKVYLLTKKLNAYLVQQNTHGIVKVSKDILRFSLVCYFDKSIERIIAGVYKFIELPDNELAQLLDYLKAANKEISDDLSEVLIYQFILKNVLYDSGKHFFEEINNHKYIDFILALENKNDEAVLSFLKDRIPFSVALANTRNNPLDLRKKIIQNLPNDKSIQKDKIKLLLKFDEKDYDKAFDMLKQLDLSSLDYFDCIPMLQVAEQKQAWDFEIVILEKLLEKEQDKKGQFSLKLKLSFAYLNLQKYPETIDLGEELLKDALANTYLDEKNREGLLTNTLFACLERGKVDDNVFARAKVIAEKFSLENPSYEYQVGIEAEVYLKNNDASKALNTIISAVKNRKTLSAREYAELQFKFIEIGNSIDFSLDSLPIVEDNTFVKLRNKDEWYFIGSGNELDAIPVLETSNRYSSFTGKKIGDIVSFDNVYASEKREDNIEIILNIAQYIGWNVYHHFQKLAKDGDLEWAQLIKVPSNAENIDIQNLLKYFEDLNSRTEPFFDLYCKNSYPLATLAISEGGLTRALEKVQSESKGFVHFSSGTNDEREHQISVARKTLVDKKSFYIDGTSALVLLDTGLLQKINKHLPNLKVPQSVIILLAQIADRFRYIPGQTDYQMGYAQGKLTFSHFEENRRELAQSNLREGIKLFETNLDNIGVISSANKVDCFAETRVPSELSDACILAQKENIPVLTEDFLYLTLNELETKKNIPEYFSSWALVRVLYEDGLLSFDEYLDHFYYLSLYRFRFLPISQEDIDKAVLGNGDTKDIKPENIKKFNFELTLSEEYGVPFDVAFRVIGVFLFRLIANDDITADILEKVFVEIIDTFPTTENKKDFGQILLVSFTKILEGQAPIRVWKLEDKMKYQKVNHLSQVIETYNNKTQVFIPKEI